MLLIDGDTEIEAAYSHINVKFYECMRD